MSHVSYTPPAPTIRLLLDLYATTIPQHTFAVFPETGRDHTYLTLHRKVNQYAQYLARLGLMKGDTVSFMMDNGQTSIELFLAALYAGYVISPLNPAAGQDQINYVVEHSDTSVIFVSETYRSVVEKAAIALDRTVRIIIADVDEGITWPAFTQKGETCELNAVSREDEGLLMYTSGTTGKPKGVLLTHKNLLAGGMNTAVAHQLKDSDRGLCVLPLCHINAQCVTVMGPLVSAGSVVVPHGFSVTLFWSWIIDNACTWFSVVPTIISYLMHQTEESTTEELKTALRNVRFGRSASAALPPALHASFEERFHIPIVETMGLTETSAQILSNPLPPAMNKYGSPGIPFGTEVRVINPLGAVLPIGEEGELQIRGDCTMRGYYKNAEETARVLTEDGWLHSGDLARIDVDGFVFITGRLKELIIKGGENIAPREIDDALYSHPSVIEAGAVGVDDPNYGQEVVACVVINEDEKVDEQQLINYCYERLGKIKTPKKIYFMDDLPKGPSGKVQRLKLLDRLPDINEKHAHCR